MVTITIDGDRARFTVEGWDKVWAMKSELAVPLDHISAVRADPQAARGLWHGLRAPGTQIPGLVTAGSFWQREGWTFFDVHDVERTIVFELNHEHYKRLVVEVADPAAEVSKVTTALAARK